MTQPHKPRNYFLPNIVVILTVTFVYLKIVGYLDWSWWWVLSPILLPFGIVVLVVALAIIMTVWEMVK